MAIKSKAKWTIKSPKGKVQYGYLRKRFDGERGGQFMLFRIVPEAKGKRR